MTNVSDETESLVADLLRVGRVGLDPGQHCRDEVAVDVTDLPHLQTVRSANTLSCPTQLLGCHEARHFADALRERSGHLVANRHLQLA